MAPEAADGVARRFRRHGACVARSGPVPLRGEAVVLVYAAHTQAEADALRALEEEIFGAPRTGDAVPLLAQTRELGARLGYPACCVAAFNARYARLTGGGPGAAAHDTWLGAVDAWVPAPRARLNALVSPHPTLISFEPCRYDCAPALAVADATAAALGEVEPAILADLDATLARPVVIAADGARAWVELAREGGVPTIVAAEALVAPGAEVRPEDARLAAEVVGRTAGATGRIEGLGDGAWPPLLVDFSAGR